MLHQDSVAHKQIPLFDEDDDKEVVEVTDINYDPKIGFYLGSRYQDVRPVRPDEPVKPVF